MYYIIDLIPKGIKDVLRGVQNMDYYSMSGLNRCCHTDQGMGRKDMRVTKYEVSSLPAFH